MDVKNFPNKINKKILSVIISIFIIFTSFLAKFVIPTATIDYNSLSVIDKVINLLPFPYIIITTTYDPKYKVTLNLDILKQEYPDLWNYFQELNRHYTTHIYYYVNYIKLYGASKVNEIWVKVGWYDNEFKLAKYDENILIYYPENKRISYIEWVFGENHNYNIMLDTSKFIIKPYKLCIDGYWVVRTPSGSHYRRSPNTEYCNTFGVLYLNNWNTFVRVT